MPIGEHTATLYYPGNDEYKPVNKSTTFTVKDPRIDPNLSIKVNDITEGQNPVAVINANNTLNGKA